VPAYNPAVVYGAWPYPAYPPNYYPYPVGYPWYRPVATAFAWGVGIGVTAALWGGCNWGRGDVNIDVNRYNNINRNNQINAGNNKWSHNVDNRKGASYRGGEAQRQNLQNKAATTNREQYRGKDGSRDASRQQASQAMQSRGIDPGTGSARERAQSVDRSAVDRSTRAQRSQGGAFTRQRVQRRRQRIRRAPIDAVRRAGKPRSARRVRA
jgi:hypothetical protein